jgi:hypothetical protein
MLKVFGFGLAMAILVRPPGTDAQQISSDLELSTAYCLGIAQTQLDASLSEPDNFLDCSRPPPFPEYGALCRQMQQDANARHQRIRHAIGRYQAYLVAKGFGSASTTNAYELALNRGKADWTESTARFKTPRSQTCMDTCSEQKDGAQILQCLKGCDPVDDSDGTFARMEHCGEVLKELPF